MKFKDIKKFTAIGHYAVDVPVEFLPKMIEDYKDEYGLEMNPDFQRGNVWTREQQIAYLEFFYRGGQSARVIYFNDSSFGHKKADSDLVHMVLVDGLQRLTAHLAFLNNEVPIFGCYYKDFEDKLGITDHTLRFNVNDLQYRHEVLKWYLEMNTGGVVHSDEEIARVQKLLDNELAKIEKI